MNEKPENDSPSRCCWLRDIFSGCAGWSAGRRRRRNGIPLENSFENPAFQ